MFAVGGALRSRVLTDPRVVTDVLTHLPDVNILISYFSPHSSVIVFGLAFSSFLDEISGESIS